MTNLRAAIRRVLAERRFASARYWSNDELRRLGPLFHGEVVNVSGWDDRDKEGGFYRDYFSSASAYSITNFRGYRGLLGVPGEQFLDLTDTVPDHLRGRFDVAFNHTTLEHLLEVRQAFRSLCALSRDIVVIVVPFAQVQHEGIDWQDYWRFTPTCIRELFRENGLDVVYESVSPQRDAAVYLLFVASKHPSRWVGALPPSSRLAAVGRWIGRGLLRTGYANIRMAVLLRMHPEAREAPVRTDRDPPGQGVSDATLRR